MNSADVANELGTDAKTLRRFIRQDPTYRNAGAGGRYTFEASDMATLRKRFAAWQDGIAKKAATKATARPRATTQADRDREVWEAEGEVVVPRMTRAVREAAEARVAELERRLLAAGLHISQMRDREEWASHTVEAGELADA